MINEKSPQHDNNTPSRLRKMALPASLLFCIGWWVSGWFMQTPAWWSQVFTIALVLALVFTWVELRQYLQNLRKEVDEEEAQEGGRLPMNAPQDPSPTLASTLGNSSSLKELAMGGHIRQFASIEDGVSHGWSFDKQIGTFNGQPLYEKAIRKEDQSLFFFDGLTRENFASMLSEGMVAFGRIRYTKSNSKPQDGTGEKSVEA